MTTRRNQTTGGQRWAELLLAAGLAGLCACGDIANDEFEGEALFELRGTVASVGLSEPLVSPRAAVLWTDELDQSSGEVPAFARIAAEVDVVTPFPAQFRLELFDEPPEVAFSAAGLAEGQLVIYDDRNGDGQLNFFDVGDDPIDRVLGDNRDAGGEETYLIYMLEAGTNDTVERVQQQVCSSASSLVWEQGFNLYEIIVDPTCELGIRFAIVPADTTVVVPVDDGAEQDLMCEVIPREARDVVDIEFDGTYPDLDANAWRCDGTTLRVDITDRSGHPCEDYTTVTQVYAAPDPVPGDWPCPASLLP